MKLSTNVSSFYKLLFLSATAMISSNAFALPIDWEGKLGIDTTRLGDYDRHQGSPTVTEGSQVVDGKTANQSSDTAAFQSYLFRLMPSIIVNDSATIKAELSTGYGRGGFLGDNTTTQQDTSVGGGSTNYMSANSRASSTIAVNQLYADLYTSAAKLRVGRFAKGWGKGLLYNAGTGDWDRFFTQFDGIEAEFKFSNITVTPYWAKLNSRAANGTIEQTRAGDEKEMGLSALYNNTDTEVKMGITYSRRKSEIFQGGHLQSNFTCQHTGTCTGGNSWYTGKSAIQIFDIYFEKTWDKVNLSLEMPMLTGDIGNIYAPNTPASVSSKAIIADIKYEIDNNWKTQLTAGRVDGDNGSTSAFEAFYVNPNFQIANILFRYNPKGVTNSAISVWDSSIVNTQFLKFNVQYFAESWDWSFSYIMANALQVAQSGTNAYHHESGYRYAANANQGKSLGNEFDFNINYLWNPNVKIFINSGILFTGDYYKFTNSSSPLAVKNTISTVLGTMVTF